MYQRKESTNNNARLTSPSADIQLQIYDLFLALRTYQRQRRLDTICTMIEDDIDQQTHESDDDSSDDDSTNDEYSDDVSIKISCVDEIMKSYVILSQK